ncbi:glucose transporter GlcP-like [Hylaeus volcanicus]|uniref:glucose transporter GlcP-like n=1 Tax=Hylaeus volcanicus TaxID=313075 RepID=UPI0023B83AA3|nr:glucose transporter GlcP-like [Hylaeus volcanicus]XP_053993755.1 glucose transporter GlcP-like [Hylaeus volcanicus]
MTSAEASNLDSKNLQDVSSLLKIKSKTFLGYNFITILVLSACIGSFLFGYNVSLLNTLYSTIEWEFGWYSDENLSKTYNTWLNTVVFVGAFLGSMTSGSLVSSGRRRLLISVMCIFLLGSINLAVSNSFSSCLWARLVSGFGVGLVSVAVPTYVSEMTPASVRGKLGVFHQLFVTVGIFVGVVLGVFLESIPEAPSNSIPRYFDRFWWRFMVLFQLIPIFLALYLFIYMFPFETPNFYIETDKPQEAHRLLRLLNQKDDVEKDMEMLFLAKKDRDVAQQKGLTLKKVFQNPVYRRVILIGCVLSAFQQLTGINVFVSRSNQMFTNAGVDKNWVTWCTILMSLVNTVMTFPSMWLIEYLGRRSLLLWGSVGMLASVAPVGVLLTVLKTSDATKIISVVGTVSFIMFFAGSYGPVLWVYLFEMFPMEIKKHASGYATAVNWLCTIIVVFFSGMIDDNTSFLFFSVCCGIAICFISIFVLETKGRNLQDSPYMLDKEGNTLRMSSKVDLL